MRLPWLVLIWCLSAVFLAWWVQNNPLPDGFQNEFIHVGNAYDLWAAAVEGDQWTLRWIAYNGYWPFGFQVASWPGLLLMGTHRLALLSANLLHLGLLLWALSSMGRAFGARWAPLLLVLCPGVFGSLVRYEPNLANIAWVAAGLACLVGSRGLRSRNHVLGWGACLGMGLMMDRLSVAFFLLPAILPLLRGVDKRAWKNLGLGLLTMLLFAGAYYREFFLRHSDELMSQAPEGEIDSAGQHMEASRGALEVLYYPLSLVDSQAGPIIGSLMLFALGSLLFKLRWTDEAGTQRAQQVLVAAVLIPVLFFSLLAKKQLYYTLPILAPLAVLAATRENLARVGILGGLWAFASQGLGVLPQGFPAGSWMPESWVAPRHGLARPPSFETWPLEQALDSLESRSQPRLIAVFSEEDRLFEGFVELALEERYGSIVHGLVTNPMGSYEFLDEFDRLVHVVETGHGWPTAAGLIYELEADHYDLETGIPNDLPVRVETLETEFEEVGRFGYDGVDLVVYQRIAPVSLH